jgi:cell division protein FtsB
MAFDWRYHLSFPLRAARRAVVPLAMLAVWGYFVLNGYYSERGYVRTQERREELALAKSDLAILSTQREALEHSVALLNGRAVGRDLLEEEARRVLSLVRPDEVVVQLPPSADDLYGKGTNAAPSMQN